MLLLGSGIVIILLLGIVAIGFFVFFWLRKVVPSAGLLGPGLFTLGWTGAMLSLVISASLDIFQLFLFGIFVLILIIGYFVGQRHINNYYRNRNE